MFDIFNFKSFWIRFVILYVVKDWGINYGRKLWMCKSLRNYFGDCIFNLNNVFG